MHRNGKRASHANCVWEDCNARDLSKPSDSAMTLPPLCDTFRHQAGAVWNRMRKAADLKMPMSEETLTETVLFETARKHQSGDFLVVPATKSEEAVHGADWLFWFVAGGKGISYRVQAKRLFPSGRYESLFKSGKDKGGQPIDPEQQLKKLIQKAKQDEHIPLYCFYNFRHSDGQFNFTSSKCSHNYRPPSFWGCSIALAEDVRFAKSDALKALRPFMIPWHLLACTSDTVRLSDAAARACRILAEPKGSPSVVNGVIQWERPQRNVASEVRVPPDYVRQMIEIQRRPDITSESARRTEIEDQARSILDEQELVGLTIFDDTRAT